MLATVTDLKGENLVVVSPDTGAVDRSKLYASILGRPWYLSADVSHLFARIIYRLHYNRSLGSLLDGRSVIKDLLKRS